jgi:hypothetical protein
MFRMSEGSVLYMVSETNDAQKKKKKKKFDLGEHLLGDLTFEDRRIRVGVIVHYLE